MDFTKTLLNNPKILILGAGITGTALIEFLKNNKADIFLFDEKPSSIQEIVQFYELNETLQNIKFDLVLKSPGIKPTHPVHKFLINSKIPIYSEIEFAKFFFKGKILGITGTDGKSTTTALTFHILKSYYPKTEMGGNIGFPFVSFCKKDLDFAVLELSSYQLDDSNFLNLDSTAFLNLAPDHLERHIKMENYMEAKKKIINRVDKNSFFITSEKLFPSLNFEKLNSPTKLKIFGYNKNLDAFIDLVNQKIITKEFTYSYKEFKLKGSHNLENLAVSILLAESVEVPSNSIQESIQNFEGLKYRFQFIKNWNGMEIINDSKSTNIHSLLSGISGIKNESLILFLGGKEKGEELNPLLNRLKELNLNLFLFGEAREKWFSEIKKAKPEKVFVYETLEECISQSRKILETEKIEKLIFSPACASFDQFKNFEDRGEKFNSLIEKYFPT